MQSALYYILGALCVVYIGILLAFNRIGRLRVKYLGFFSLYGITLQTPDKIIRVKKLRLRINLLRGKDSPLKLFNLELYDTDVQLLAVEKNHEPFSFSIEDVLQFLLSKKLYDFLFYYQILNQFHILFYRLSMCDESSKVATKLHVDYAKLENLLRYDGHNSLTLSAFNGFLHDIEDHERIRIFRNIEIILSCDVIFCCSVKDSNIMASTLTNFSLGISLGKAHVPMDHIQIKPKSQNPKEPSHPISKGNISQLRYFWKVFTEAKLSLEDFTISLGPCLLQIATLQTSLIHNREIENAQTSVADFNFHLTSVKFFEAETKCFELPAATCAFEANPFGLLQGIENSHITDVISSVETTLDIKFNLTVTAPTIDLYHDQLLWFRLRSKIKPRTKSSFAENVNILNFLLVLQKVSTKIVIVDGKLLVHLPAFGQQEFHRSAGLNLITTYKIDSIVQRFATTNLRRSLSYQDEGQQHLYGLFKVKNGKAEFRDNTFHISKCNVLATYNIKDKDVSLKMNCKRIKLKSINSAIFQLVKEVRTNRIKMDNKLYHQLKTATRPEDPHKDAPQGEYFELFLILPESINHLKIDLNEVQADIICKDTLPLQVFVDPETNEEFDLKDYGRGISVKLNDTVICYKRDKEEIMMRFRSFNCYTLSEFDLDYVVDFDVVTSYSTGKDGLSDVSSLESITLAQAEEEDLRRVKQVFEINEIEINNYSNKQKDTNKLSVRVPEMDGRLDIFLAWCSVYASTLFKNFEPTVERLCSKKEIKSMMGVIDKKLKMDIWVGSIAIVTRLPNRVDVLSEFDTLLIKDVFDKQSIEFKYFRGYIVHPITKLWARFLTIKGSFVAFNTRVENTRALEIASKGIRLNIPHGFLFYTVIDNIVTFGKAVKQITHNFNNLTAGVMDFNALPQEARDAFQMPTVNIKTEVFGMTLENDPFETELAYILELSALEQQIRIKKWKIFEAKEKEIMSNVIDLKIKLHPSESIQTNGRINSKIFAKRHTSINNLDSKVFQTPENAEPMLSEEEAKERIDHARECLESELSSSWILRFKRFRSSKIKNWRSRIQRAWGVEKVNDKVTEKFDIMNYYPGPPLLGTIFRDFDLTVNRSSICDLDKFLHDYGKNQPKLDYSILVPFHILMKASGVFAFLKDYSLPLLSFPTNDDPEKSAFQLEGNIVINEKLVHRKEEMRRIWVPFSPPMAAELKDDSFYSVFVTRTLTPVKFMVDLKCKIDSQRAAMISWCKSYQAGLLAAMSAVDNFTKPQIDDSPLGWWDKMGLILHGQMTFDIPNELCFHMKASTSPYHMTGRNAGFVFCWKNNVVLEIDGMRSSKDLITLLSDDFLLAIPNYSVAEKRSWSLFYDEMNEAVPDIESEAKKYQKKVMRLSSDERVQWTLGLLFERNKNFSSNLSDQEERVDVFVPHYDVVVTSPNYDWHPDSYKGYRSDYIHLAISVKSVSAKGNASNSIHFTPLTYSYFFYWWDTLTEAITLPIRQGELFRDLHTQNHVSVKTSTHLFTVKYQLILEPLSISYMQMHSSGDKDNRIGFTGLKGRVTRCVLDLHQRKELLTYVNRKLNIENQILHLKMNQAEISFDDADVRIVSALFPEKSMQSQLDQYIFGADTSSGEIHSGTINGTEGESKYSKMNFEFNGEDFSWLDAEDFTELELREVLSPYPQVTVLPFCYSPRFTYVREFSLQEDGPFPFGNENSHNCELGREEPTDTQGRLIRNRLVNINAEISANEDLLTSFQGNELDPLSKEQIEKINRTIKEYKEKKDLLESVYESVTGELYHVDASQEESLLDISRLNSRLLSVYSSHRSHDDARQAGLLNKVVSEFHNRFIIHNMQLKWDNQIRDHFMSYLQYLSDKKSEYYFMSKKAVDLVESVINSAPESYDENEGNEEACRDKASCEDTINGFEEYLDDVDDETQEAEHKFLIKLISPQIQLLSEANPDHTAIVVSKDLEMRINLVNLKGVHKLVNADSEITGIIETRYGGLFRSTAIYVFNKKDVVISHPDVPYGYVGSQLAVSWPPWVEYENICEDYWLKNELVAERTSMGLMFKKPNYLYIDRNSMAEKNEIKVHVAKVVINADSQQYSTLYYMITDLLVYGKTQKNLLMNKLDKVISVSDKDDFVGLDERVKTLQSSIRELHTLVLKIDNKALKLSPLESQNLHQVELELEKKKLELSMIMRGLKLRNLRSSNKRASRSWTILVDQIIWHFLDSEKRPLIDLALANSHFHRIDSVDGSNRNEVEVGLIQGFNLQEKVVYPELLSPIHDEDKSNDKPLIVMTWKMLNPVGGIPIMQQAKLSIQPLKIQLDYHTAKVLFEYVFPKSEHGKTDNKDVPTAKRYPSGDLSLDMPLGRPKNIFKHHFGKNDSSPDEEDSSSIISRRTDSVSTRFSSSEDLSVSTTETSTKFSRPKKKKTVEDDISLIVSRSSKFVSIVDIEVDLFKLFISFKAPKHLNIIDVHNLLLNIPNIRYHNKTWSGEDFILRLRRDITKIILQHTGQIIGNKFKIRKRKLLQEPLKQISNYASFLSVQDLQNEQERREAPPGRSHHHHHSRHYRDVSNGSLPESANLASTNGTAAFETFLQEIIDEEDEDVDRESTSISPQ